MAFRLNPKSPLLKSTGRYGSPAKKTISELREEPGMSNAGKYPNVAKDDFAGPDGTYPINTIDRARSALRLAHNAKNPEAIKAKVYAKYPELKPNSSPAKQLGVDPAETAGFEKSKEIEGKFEEKIEAAGDNEKKVKRLEKRANQKMARKVPRAEKRAAKKGYTMSDGTYLSPLKQEESTAGDLLMEKLDTKDHNIERMAGRLDKTQTKIAEAQKAGKEGKVSRLEKRSKRLTNRATRRKKQLDSGKSQVGYAVSKGIDAIEKVVGRQEGTAKYNKDTKEGGTKVGNILRDVVGARAEKYNKSTGEGGTKVGNFIRKTFPKKPSASGEAHQHKSYDYAKRLGPDWPGDPRNK